MIALAIAGLGKIARDQHVPALAASSQFELAATIDPFATAIAGIPHFADLAAMRSAMPQVTALAVCTPPQVRAELAAEAIRAGLNVLLEKPPAASLSQAQGLARMAQECGTSLFAAWHSRGAGGVAPARAWLADKTIRAATITWREDVRHWHPGQPWIWQAGGLGVFDPGINALSLLTALLPDAVVLDRAVLDVPANCAAPIAARLDLLSGAGVRVQADFDFRQNGPQTWEIAVETDAGPLLLAQGGAALTLPGAPPQTFADGEYAALYTRFADLIAQCASDVDLAPLTLVADAFLLGQQRTVEPFYD
jgi:D-galactose 1-dehydrogenase